MALGNAAQHISQAAAWRKRVLLVGTADEVYKRGTGVCYNRDYGTAADEDGSRDKRVEKPSITNHNWFAGVLSKTVTIPATGKVWVEVFEPGSTCLIAIGQQNAVVGATRFGLSVGGADAGRFGLAGFPGKGGALALQTVSLRCVQTDGSAAYTSATKTLADTGEYASVVAGDTVVIIGADGGTLGEYVVASRTDNTLVFATDILGADRAKVTAYVLESTNETLCLAKLEDGPVSGCQEVVQALNNAAVTFMVGGYTYIACGTLAAGDSTNTVADGTYPGQVKAIHCLGANGTNDVDVTITSHETSDPEHLFFKAADEVTVLEWFGESWYVRASNAPTAT